MLWNSFAGCGRNEGQVHSFGVDRPLISRFMRTAACLMSFVLIVFFSTQVFGQLVGGNAYPINGVQDPPASFGTIKDAANYLSSANPTGTGQVILEISPGYLGEPEDWPGTIFSNIESLNSNLGVTVRPAAGFTALTSSVGIRNPYVTFDGRGGGTGAGHDWTIRSTSGNDPAALIGHGDRGGDIAIRYCILEGQGAGSDGILVVENVYSVTVVTIEHNWIRGGGASSDRRDLGIEILAQTGNEQRLEIRENLITQVATMGMQLYGAFQNSSIMNNEIYHTAPISSGSKDFAGIFISSSELGGTQVSGNFIHDILLTDTGSDVSGIELFGTSAGEPIHIYNNRIAIGSGVQPTDARVWGIWDHSSGPFEIDHNSVYVGGSPNGGSANSAAFRRDQASALKLRNNVFCNQRSNTGTASGTHWAISISNTNGLSSVSNNNYFVDGAGAVLGTTSGSDDGNRATLASWKQALPMDGNSVFGDPHYISPTGSPPVLKVDPNVSSTAESRGVLIQGIAKDFEGEPRFGSEGYSGTGSAPDIGADEFEGMPGQTSEQPAIHSAALASGTRCYFFSGAEYIRVTRGSSCSGVVDRGYPRSIAQMWGWGTFGSDGIDAALQAGPKCYFFSGTQYVRVTRGNTGPGTIDPGYPKSISQWAWGNFGKTGIDAALESGTKSYFFSGTQYIRVTRGGDEPWTVDPGYPKDISTLNWGTFGQGGIDSAMSGDDKSYFFSGNRYLRVNRTDSEPWVIDSGYPKAWGWPASFQEAW